MIGFAFGASLISIFNATGRWPSPVRADVGIDLVGKVEAGIPGRRSAQLRHADNVSDNVGDCAGMAADLFETFAVTVIATMLIGGFVFKGSDAGIIYPLVISGVDPVDPGCFFVARRRQDHERAVPRPAGRRRDLAGAVHSR